MNAHGRKRLEAEYRKFVLLALQLLTDQPRNDNALAATLTSIAEIDALLG